MKRLPRLQSRVEIAEAARTPTRKFQQDWQTVVEAIEAGFDPEATVTASAATTTHKVPVTIGGVSYFILLSNV